MVLQSVRKWHAEYDYTAADGDEVSFVEGDILVDVVEVDEGWVTVCLATELKYW